VSLGGKGKSAGRRAINPPKFLRLSPPSRALTKGTEIGRGVRLDGPPLHPCGYGAFRHAYLIRFLPLSIMLFTRDTPWIIREGWLLARRDVTRVT